METVVVRLWDWPEDQLRSSDLRGVVVRVRSGEELPFRNVDELIAILSAWRRGDSSASDGP